MSVNVTSDSTESESVIVRNAINTISLGTAVLGILADFLVAATIIGAKELQSTRNMVVLNWTISDFLYLLCVPMKHVMYLKLRQRARAYLILSYCQALMKLSVIINIALLSSTFFYMRLTKQLLLQLTCGMWIVNAILLITVNIFGEMWFLNYITTAGFFALTIVYFVRFFMYVNDILNGKTAELDTRFVIVCSYTSCWFISNCFQLASFFIKKYQPILDLAANLFQLLGYPYPILLLVLLIYLDTDFLISFIHLITCQWYSAKIAPKTMVNIAEKAPSLEELQKNPPV